MIKYYLILILSISDAICTGVGITQGFIVEANPLLVEAYASSSLLASLIVIMAVMMQLITLYWAERQYKWVEHGIWMVLCVKVWVLLLHVYWITMVNIYF